MEANFDLQVFTLITRIYSESIEVDLGPCFENHAVGVLVWQCEDLTRVKHVEAKPFANGGDLN